MARQSRYAQTSKFAPDDRGNSDFQGVRPREISRTSGVLEHRVTAGERLDQLSNNYFNDDRLWWRLGDAGASFLYAPDMLADMSKVTPPDKDPLERDNMVGRIVLIPRAQE